MCSAISRRTPAAAPGAPLGCGSEPLAPDTRRRTSSSVIAAAGARAAQRSQVDAVLLARSRLTSGVARTRPESWTAASHGRFGRGRRRLCTVGADHDEHRPDGDDRRPPRRGSATTTPAAGDGISTVVLSVWISTSGSSSAISCPSATSQRATSPSVRPSPRSGSLNSYARLANSVSEAGVADDEAVAVELQVRGEGATAEADDTAPERHVPLRRTLHRQLGRRSRTPSCTRARRRPLVQAVAQNGQRVEERRAREVEVEHVVAAAASCRAAGRACRCPCTVSTSARSSSLTNMCDVSTTYESRYDERSCVPRAREAVVAELDERQLEEVRPLPRVELHRGVPIHASAGAISTRSPPSTRHSDTACSSPRTLGRDVARHVADLQRALLVPDRHRVRIVLVVGLAHERQPPPRIERRVRQASARNETPATGTTRSARIAPAHRLAGRRVAQVEARPAALEPQTQPLRTQAACERRRARARPTACTRPRSASTDTARRSR